MTNDNNEKTELLFDIEMEGEDKKPLTVGEFKRWRKKTINDLNGILQGFQKNEIETIRSTRLTYNIMNAVIKAFLDRGLVTAEDIQKAGSDLYQESMKNMEVVKKATAEKRKIMPFELVKTPIDIISQQDVVKNENG